MLGQSAIENSSDISGDSGKVSGYNSRNGPDPADNPLCGNQVSWNTPIVGRIDSSAEISTRAYRPAGNSQASIPSGASIEDSKQAM